MQQKISNNVPYPPVLQYKHLMTHHLIKLFKNLKIVLIENSASIPLFKNSLKSYRYACMHHNCANVNYKTIKIYFSHSLDMENVQHLYNVERETHRINFKENTWNSLNMIHLYLVSLLTVLYVYAGAYMSCIHKHLFIPF